VGPRPRQLQAIRPRAGSVSRCTRPRRVWAAADGSARRDLAGWWILTADGVPTDRQGLDGVVAVTEFVLHADEVADRSSARLVAEHLGASKLTRDSSTEQVPVAEMLLHAWQVVRDPKSGAERAPGDSDGWQRDLERNGIRAVRASDARAPRGGPGDGLWLHLHSPDLADIFRNTPSPGQKWPHILRGLPSVVRAPDKVRIGAINARADLWISRADLLGEDSAR